MDLSRAALIAGTLLLGASACELSDAFAPARPKYDGPELTGHASPRDTETKLSMYLRCQDSLADVIEESWSRLDDQVDERGRLRRRRRLFVYPIPASLFRTCDQTLREGPEAVPSMPEIERSAEEMVGAAKAFAELTRDLDAYLENDGLQMDDGANVQVLYPLLLDAHTRWRRSDSILSLNLNAAKRVNDPELLAQLAAEGRDVEYHARAIIIRARALVACVEAATNDEKTEPSCGEELDAFDETYREFAEFYEAHRFRADKVFWMRTYAEDVTAFHERVDDMRPAIDGKGRARPPKARDVEEFVDGFRRLFRGAETLDFTFPVE